MFGKKRSQWYICRNSVSLEGQKRRVLAAKEHVEWFRELLCCSRQYIEPYPEQLCFRFLCVRIWVLYPKSSDSRGCARIVCEHSKILLVNPRNGFGC
jgi:hypothetical protein